MPHKENSSRKDKELSSGKIKNLMRWNNIGIF
jgi:hypothetical protein